MTIQIGNPLTSSTDHLQTVFIGYFLTAQSGHPPISQIGNHPTVKVGNFPTEHTGNPTA